MKNIVSSSIIVAAPAEQVWKYVSDFSHAGHQVIAVESTEMTGKDRLVTFKNGHQVKEHLLGSPSNGKIRWSQENKKGFVPIKNVEVEIQITPGDKNSTNLQFSFFYDTIMGPIGWMMNIFMVKGKLTHIAEQNSGKIQKHFEGQHEEKTA